MSAPDRHEPTLRLSVARAFVAELADDPAALEELRELLDTAQGERMVKAPEAADVLGIHPKTLTRAAAAGRVVGAQRVGARGWRFKLSELELLPPEPSELGPAPAGRGIRRPGASSATMAIRGAQRAA